MSHVTRGSCDLCVCACVCVFAGDAMAGIHVHAVLQFPWRHRGFCQCHGQTRHRTQQVHGNGKSNENEVIITHHHSLSPPPQKSYKYGCGLISAAGKGRKSFQLGPQASHSLLDSHTSSWEKLSSGATEVEERLKMARHFHALLEEVGVASF